MPYSKTTWVSGTTPVDATEMNNLETSYTEATLSFGPDLFTPFILTGYASSRNGGTLTQLDVTAGTAYVKQTDNTLRQRVSALVHFSTVGFPSTTMFLDLNPDGTFSFGTSHSGTANHLTLATVTTDASANISTVTDTRVTTTQLLPGMIGLLQAAGLLVVAGPSSSNLPAAGIKGRVGIVCPFTYP